MQEKEYVQQILKKAIKSVREDNIFYLKELSNHTIHSASLYQDPDNISIAVVLYSLSKILERKSCEGYEDCNRFLKDYVNLLNKAYFFLEKNDLESYRDQINQIQTNIKKLGSPSKKYVLEVFRKAKINKASKIYEHGISLHKTAKILGLSLWELNDYIGQSKANDNDLVNTKDVKQRINDLEKVFK